MDGFYSLQREGVSELSDVSALASLSFVFLFPSNGKAFLNKPITALVHHLVHQFLFPSTGTAFLNEADRIMDIRFPELFLFPSPGKAFRTISKRISG